MKPWGAFFQPNSRTVLGKLEPSGAAEHENGDGRPGAKGPKPPRLPDAMESHERQRVSVEHGSESQSDASHEGAPPDTRCSESGDGPREQDVEKLKNTNRSRARSQDAKEISDS